MPAPPSEASLVFNRPPALYSHVFSWRLKECQCFDILASMKSFAVALLAVFFLHLFAFAADTAATLKKPVVNRAPLRPKAFNELPLGAIEAHGWMREQLDRMRTGLTGDLDQRYEKVVGLRNGWLGGDGDGWERGPYWLDGLVPLGHILRDDALLAKAKPWIEWTLTHQEPSGYLGPKRFDVEPPAESGIQKTPREDWWPRMVMLKVLQQHHSATGDPRVIEVLLRYFRYQLRELPRTPLDHWSFWANRRAGDNLAVVYWLYNVTGEPFLLELAELIHKQTFPWTEVFLNTEPAPSPDPAHLYPYNTRNRYPFNRDLIRRLSVDQLQSFHCVNLAQGIKEPVVYFQQNGDERHLRAVKQAIVDIKRFHGQAQGMYGGDEPMHGNDPTQGVELCSVVEMMFSLETMLAITGDLEFADQLEKIAFNALPAQTTEDFRHRQYFQSANQVLCTRARRNFYEDDWHGGTDSCIGLLNGFPCCTCNMHQGWPKLVQSLWHATADGGIAALVYGPSQVTFETPGGVRVQIVEQTNYPFEETVRFVINTPAAVAFPFRLRVPAWATSTSIRLNGQLAEVLATNRLLTVSRTWNPGDKLEVQFGAAIRTTRWAEQSVAVERGPLVFALRIAEEWTSVRNADEHGDFFEVRPKSPWNYALLDAAVTEPGIGFMLIRRGAMGYPWSQEGSPIEIRTQGKRVPEWQLYNNKAGPLPHSRPQGHLEKARPEDIVLLPYGATRLRITQFPVAK